MKVEIDLHPELVGFFEDLAQTNLTTFEVEVKLALAEKVMRVREHLWLEERERDIYADQPPTEAPAEGGNS